VLSRIPERFQRMHDDWKSRRRIFGQICGPQKWNMQTELPPDLRDLIVVRAEHDSREPACRQSAFSRVCQKRFAAKLFDIFTRNPL
jgi:hypothetical protein